jgi:hypothetical protein
MCAPYPCESANLPTKLCIANDEGLQRFCARRRDALARAFEAGSLVV